MANLTPRLEIVAGIETVSAGAYEGIAREIVHRLKFSARLRLAEVAAERMVRAWGATREGTLVAVPPAPARHRTRGFDPASALATQVARRCVGANVDRLLARDDGPRQVGRQRDDRLADPPRISVLESTDAAPAEDIWLVDDVATTGATLMACADALERAGAERVRALVFARADG